MAWTLLPWPTAPPPKTMFAQLFCAVSVVLVLSSLMSAAVVSVASPSQFQSIGELAAPAVVRVVPFGHFQLVLNAEAELPRPTDSFRLVSFRAAGATFE